MERVSGPSVKGEQALRVENVSKTFPGQLALDRVDLEIARGQVRALLGENGSGKSTLIKILAGYHQPDPGARGWAEGEPLQLGSAAAARAAGLRFIHQDLGLVNELDVIDNLALGERYVGTRWLSRHREAKEARRLLAGFGVEVDVHAPVGSLAPAERTIIAVVRALRDQTERTMLVLDEPTASLSGAEVARLMEVVRAVRDRGGAILYVTHRLQEVFDIADTVTVLRDGKLIASRPVAGLDHDQLVEMLVGRPIQAVFPSAPAVGSDVVFHAQDIRGARITGVSLQVNRGEILGVAGIIGSGREELPYLLFGARPWHGGRIQLNHQNFSQIDIRTAIAAGIAFLPADRQRHSTFPTMLVRENLTLPQIPRSRFAWWVSTRREHAEVQGWLEQLDVRPPDPERMLSSLSGGNQQRVVLARWLRCLPKLLLLEEPTGGVDIAAKAEIYKLIEAAARDGMACIVCSSDAEELAGICDRVIVLRDGVVAAELSGESLTEEEVVTHTITKARAAA
jgi:ribose transport system ATP-binding protein